MWLGHSIEHLVCIGGELEHHQALSPSAARKNRAVCSALTRGGIYRNLIGPGWWHEPGLKGSLWSRFRPPTGTNGGGPGARHIGPGSSHQPGPKGPDEPGPMAHVARPDPGAHEPGPMPPWVPVLDCTWTNRLTRPGPFPPFLLVMLDVDLGMHVPIG